MSNNHYYPDGKINQAYNNWRPTSENVIRRNSCANLQNFDLQGQFNVPQNSCYKNVCVDQSARQLPNIHRQSICRPDEYGQPDMCGVQELNRLREDVCYLNTRDYQSKKPLKFQTFQWRPYYWLTGEANPQTGVRKGGVIVPSYPGFNAWDGSVGSCTIGGENELKISNVMNTNPRLIQELPELRPNQPRIRGFYSPDQESFLIESRFQGRKKTCLNNEVQLFESNVLVPFVFPKFFPNRVQSSNATRGGISTTSQLRTNYVSGKYCARAMVPTRM